MSDRDPASFEGAATPVPPEVRARLVERLAERAAQRDDATLHAAARELRGRRSPLGHPLTWLVAALAAVAAVVITLVVAPTEAPEQPASFGTPREGARTPTLTLQQDADGRLRRVAPSAGDGEHLLFRGERLVRIEPHRGGQVHGVVVELDGQGGVLALRTFQRGVERGPWVELDGRGAVTGTGVRW